MTDNSDDREVVKHEPMRKWEKLVKEHIELAADTETDTSERRREINEELRDIAKADRRHWEEWYQSHREAVRESDQEIER